MELMETMGVVYKVNGVLEIKDQGEIRCCNRRKRQRVIKLGFWLGKDRSYMKEIGWWLGWSSFQQALKFKQNM